MRENFKILEITGQTILGWFVCGNLYEYHNGARSGCLQVLEEVKKGGWASLEVRLREFFLGKKVSRPGKEVVASGGGFEKSISNHKNLGIDEKKFPKISGHVNRHEGCVGLMARLGRSVKARASTTLTQGWR